MQTSVHGSTTDPIGRALSRVDGRAKVTGTAPFAAEAPLKNMAYGVIVQSTIARGRIIALNTAAAQAAAGVLLVLTPQNMPKLQAPKGIFFGEERMPLSDMAIYYAGQHVAVIIADTAERARWAASVVQIRYAEEKPRVDLHDPAATIDRPAKNFGEPIQIEKGNVESAAVAKGVTAIRETYRTPTHTHNPIEMSATTAYWEGNHLTVWDSTQDVSGTRDALAGLFHLKPEDVRVICPFTGGGFGCKGTQWPHTSLAVVAAKLVRRPVRLMLKRQQMFTSCGHRPPTEQALMVAAGKDGKLVAISHATITRGSTVGSYVETCGVGTSAVLYDTPNLKVTHAVHKVDIATPTFMRAPGETPGSFALESAMDELAYQLSLDPVELRLINYAEKHPQTGLPWSSKQLRQCYQLGIERSGWAGRNPKPGSMQDEQGRPVGWGMATASYPALTNPGLARIRVMSDGHDGLKAIAAAATQDLGTGTWTIGLQITAAELGLPLDKVRFDLGDSNLPASGMSGGSATAASLTRNLTVAAFALRSELLKLANTSADSPLRGLKPGQVAMRGNRLVALADSDRSVDLNALIVKSGRAYIEGQGTQPAKNAPVKIKGPSDAGLEDYEANSAKFAFQSFGAHFVQVTIDEPIPLVRVRRVISVMDIGRVLNRKTATSQVIGGVTMGLGAALMEETHYDPQTAQPVTANLADYAVPVNPDVHRIEAYFTDVPDLSFNALGCRGVGEIGITGVAAAVANAVFHATGKRIRDLPITPDKLLV